MFTVLNPHQELKRQAALIMLFAGGIGAIIATLIHYQQPHAHLIDKIAPPLIAIACVTSFIQLYRKPESLNRLSTIAPVNLALLVIIPSWFFTINAFASTSTTLIDSYPPLTAPLFLWTTVTLVFSKPQHLLKIVGLGWFVGATPVLIYLLLHPIELKAPRGLDLFISFGPAMIIQITMVLFYSRLQVLVDKLYAERLQYYSKVIEEQAIRSCALEQAFTQFHNGPLQSLAILLRDVQQDQVPSPEIFQRLAQLNAEIRDLGQSLIKSTQTEESTTSLTTSLDAIASGTAQRAITYGTAQRAIAQSTLRLGSGTHLDLSLPLHNLLYEVYAVTLKRKLPYFESIRVKVRNFAPLENTVLTFELKGEICLWLEEALCNVGKHAQGVTRIQVTGTFQDGKYTLKVQDNGVGCTPKSGEGTKQSNRLAQRLRGTFRRESLPKGGTTCELAWLVEVRNSPL